MHTKTEFLSAIRDSVANYPAVAALYQAGDPRMLQALEAIATMAAMLSQQQELAMLEPFIKSRDSTILAEAALRGLVPMGKPARVRVAINNAGLAPFTLVAGRNVLDSNGRIYVVDAPVSVPAATAPDAPGTAVFEAVQVQVRTVAHNVAAGEPFYKIEVPAPQDGQYVAGVEVRDAALNEFAYRQEFTNVAPNERVYHMETDEYRRLYVKFGYGDVVGYQPASGETLTIEIHDTQGDVRPENGSPFAFEYTVTPEDSLIEMRMDALLIPGANPIDITVLRELMRYPSAYDHSAVYLGEFDYLVRNRVPGLRFLSVWNEQIEEKVRGANVDNINKLFVSVVPADGGDQLATEAQIEAVIMDADDSYRIQFVPPVVSLVEIDVQATIARVHDGASVQARISDVLLGEYGVDSQAVRRGMQSPQYKRIFATLRDMVPALQDTGSDFKVEVGPPPDPLLPEHYRYADASSITVSVALANYNIGNWGY